MEDFVESNLENKIGLSRGWDDSGLKVQFIKNNNAPSRASSVYIVRLKRRGSILVYLRLRTWCGDGYVLISANISPKQLRFLPSLCTPCFCRPFTPLISLLNVKGVVASVLVDAPGSLVESDTLSLLKAVFSVDMGRDVFKLFLNSLEGATFLEVSPSGSLLSNVVGDDCGDAAGEKSEGDSGCGLSCKESEGERGCSGECR